MNDELHVWIGQFAEIPPERLDLQACLKHTLGRNIHEPEAMLDWAVSCWSNRSPINGGLMGLRDSFGDQRYIWTDVVARGDGVVQGRTLDTNCYVKCPPLEGPW